jgi:hypothetical protein
MLQTLEWGGALPDLCWVSIGRHDEMEVFVSALKEVLS